MTLIKTSTIDLIEVTEFNTIQVRENIKIIDESTNNVVSFSYHRNMLTPGQDLTGQDPEVISIANSVWTPEVISEFKALNSLQKIN